MKVKPRARARSGPAPEAADSRVRRVLEQAVAIVWLPGIWVLVKYGLDIPDRYLPGPPDIVRALDRVGTTMGFHAVVSVSRLLVGYVLGCLMGILLGVCLYRYRVLERVVAPGIQALRAVPSTATIPFFILWFGFAERGKQLIIVLGISLNLAVAVLQILHNVPEKYTIAFKVFRMPRRALPFRILLPFAFESILPTLRFSLAVAISLIVVAEYLGAQSGLGYLIQSARTTYSFDVVVLAASIFGLITWALDASLGVAWRWLVPWRKGVN